MAQAPAGGGVHCGWPPPWQHRMAEKEDRLSAGSSNGPGFADLSGASFNTNNRGGTKPQK